ncbi:DeoR/GlpR family DNA-binding transcription regulator [Albidovulum sp.]
MSKHEQELRAAVHLRGTVRVGELAAMLGVSDQTVRRIVQPLVESGEVRKVHGAIVSQIGPADPPFRARMARQRREKAAIAQAVAGLVPDGAVVAIDTGSTSGFVAQALARRRALTVVTNSAMIAATLATVEGNRVFMAGTQLRDHDGAAFDRTAFDVIAGFSVDFAILSASRVHPDHGFLVHDQGEVDIAAAMMRIADRAVMAVDSSKFTDQPRRPALRLPALAPGDIVVTDAPPPAAFAALLAEQELVVAPPERA